MVTLLGSSNLHSFEFSNLCLFKMEDDGDILSNLTTAQLGELLAAVSDDIERGHIVKRLVQGPKILCWDKEEEGGE